MRFAGWQLRSRLTGLDGYGESVSGSTEAQSLTFSSDYHPVDVAMEQPQPNMNEICYVLVGQQRNGIWVGRLLQRREGKATSVSFDWGWVMVREESFGDVIGFYHTHPTGSLLPSQRDVRTMQAWVDCFGKPLLCAIQSGERLAGYLFEEDSRGVPVSRISRMRGNVVVAME